MAKRRSPSSWLARFALASAVSSGALTAALSSSSSSSALSKTGDTLGQSKPTFAARFCSFTARVSAGRASGTSPKRERGLRLPRSAFSASLIRVRGQELLALRITEDVRMPPHHLPPRRWVGGTALRLRRRRRRHRGDTRSAEGGLQALL